MTIGRIVRIVGHGSVLAGAALVVCAASVTLRARVWQDRNAALFAGSASAGPGSTSAGPGPKSTGSVPTSAGSPAVRRGEAIARLSIPRLGIRTVVVEGTDTGELALGPGHLEGSALPGEADNCIIAGHRDGPFGRLRSVRRGDVLEIEARSGPTARYRVDSVDVVDKNDMRPLAPSREALLTLITCYPFNYVGHAPGRFIVRASLVSAVPARAVSAQPVPARAALLDEKDPSRAVAF